MSWGSRAGIQALAAPILAAGGRLFRPLRAAQHRANPGEQLPGVKRFANVIIGADLEADNPVDIFTLGGHDDDGNVALAFQPPRHGQPVFARQHQVCLLYTSDAADDYFWV